MLRGCLIPIINTIFIVLSTTAYLFTLFSSSCPKTQPLESLVQERPKSNLLQLPSPLYRKTTLPRCAVTRRPTPRMMKCRCSSTSTPDSRYSRVDKNEKPLGRFVLNALWPSERVDLRITLQPVIDRIQIVSIVSQT
jgi:hypothetical protein